MRKILTLTKIFLRSSLSNMNTKMGMPSNVKGKYLSKILYTLLFLYLAGIIIILSLALVYH